MTTSTKLETITPVMAKKWLEKMIANRPLSEGKSLEYAISMDEGKWIVNGATIVFDDKDRLIDGQHRLQACMLAEKPFSSYVVRGVDDPMAFATIDQGKGRTHGDIFSVAGYPDPNNAAAAGMLIYLYKHDLISVYGVKQRRFTKNMSSAVVSKLEKMPVRASNITKEDLLEYCRSFKTRLIESVRFSGRVKKNKLMVVSMIAACHILFAEKSKEDADKFFVDMFAGTGLKGTDPVFLLRERLIFNQSSNNKLTRYMTFALVLKAWNKRRSGDGVKSLRMADGEDFPKAQ